MPERPRLTQKKGDGRRRFSVTTLKQGANRADNDPVVQRGQTVDNMRKARARWPEVRSRLPNQAGLTSPSDQIHRKNTSTQRKLQGNPVCCSAASAFRHTLREKGSAACHPRGPSRVWQSSRPAIDLLRSLNHCEPGLARTHPTRPGHCVTALVTKWRLRRNRYLSTISVTCAF